MPKQCKSIGCVFLAQETCDFCDACIQKQHTKNDDNMTMAQKYPKYYKPVGDMTEIDVYAVHHMFNINDPSGAIQHSSKKLLLSGVRTGGKSKFQDIKEARDTLTRWLQLNEAVPA